MLFDEQPKNNKEDLFDRTKELEEFSTAIKSNSRLIVITGHRRVGKTSLLKTMLALNEHNISMDLRLLSAKRYARKSEVIQLVQDGLDEYIDNIKTRSEEIRKALQAVNGVHFGDFGIEFDNRNKDLTINKIFSKINELAKKNNQTVLLAIDEAQEYRKSIHYDIRWLLAHIYDHCNNITIVLTGSEVGLLYKFIGVEDPKSRLYEKYFCEIHLESLSPEKSKEFLNKGFAQYNLGIEKEPTAYGPINSAADRLGGVLGWLIKFGVTCVEHEKISSLELDKIQKEGSILARHEFDNFVRTRSSIERYEIIMAVLAGRPSKWNTIKIQLSIDMKKEMYSKNLCELLDTLQKAGHIIKNDNDHYAIVDPLLAASFKE